MVSSSGDASVRMWEVETGVQLAALDLSPTTPRCAAWSPDMTRVAVTVDGFGSTHIASVHVYAVEADETGRPCFSAEPVLVLHNGPTEQVEFESDSAFNARVRDKASVVAWLPPLEGLGPETDGLLVARHSGTMSVYNPDDGTVLLEALRAHDDEVKSLRFNRDGTLFVTSSADKSVKLWNTRDLQLVKAFNVDTAMNGCAISPILPHVFMAGGQEARNVTTTDASAGHFETRVHHIAWGDELARIPGHFGTVNSLDISPDGTTLATGGEDGYLRLNFLPPNYFKLGQDKDLEDPAVRSALDTFMEAVEAEGGDPSDPGCLDSKMGDRAFQVAEDAYVQLVKDMSA